MEKFMVKNRAKRKENKMFPYEMTELVWEGEKELEKSLRKDVRQIELQIKRQMFLQSCKGLRRCFRSVAAAGN